MQERIPRWTELVATGTLLVVSWAQANRVSAHAAPASPPLWDPGPCIVVVDRDAQASVQFAYRLEMDDTMLTTGDIDLPDAMTHQFFAFRGAIIFEGFAPEVWSFEPNGPNVVPLPLWITRGDIERAQKRSDETALGYDLSEVTPEKTLETMSALSDRWVRITGDDARRPITLDQALLGVDWNVRDAEPGLYALAGYIFSPPYNGWEVRQGLVKVKDAADDPPAAVVGRVQESLFTGQGRKVRTCLDVPAGTRMRTYARVEKEPGAEWVEWGREEEVATGEEERCFLPADSALAGSLRLRFDLTRGGETRSFYSPDTLLVLGGEAPCSESATVCCPAADGAGADAAVSDAATLTPDAAAASERKPAHDPDGCAVSRSGRASSTAAVWLVVALWLARRLRRSQQQRHAE